MQVLGRSRHGNCCCIELQASNISLRVLNSDKESCCKSQKFNSRDRAGNSDKHA